MINSKAPSPVAAFPGRGRQGLIGLGVHEPRPAKLPVVDLAVGHLNPHVLPDRKIGLCHCRGHRRTDTTDTTDTRLVYRHGPVYTALACAFCDDDVSRSEEVASLLGDSLVHQIELHAHAR